MVNKKKTTVAVLALSSVLQAFMAVSPILAEIGRSFPEASASQVQMVYTIASLVALPMMLLTGRLVYRFTKRSLSILGMIIMVGGGLLPLVLNSKLWMLYLASGVVGLGMALVNVLSSTLISDYFSGLDKGKVMGYQSATLSLGGAIMSSISGLIAANYGWVYSYLVFLLGLPMIIITFRTLPKDTLMPKPETKGEGIHGRLIYYSILAFFGSVLINAFNTNIAMYLEERAFGGAAVSGTVGSIFMLVGIPAGILLGPCIKLMGKHVIGVMTLIIALGFFVTALAPSLWVVYLGAFLVGFGFAVRAPGAITFAANMVPAAAAAMAIAIHNSFGSVGNFLSPLLVNWLSSLFGESITTTLLVAGTGIAILGCLYLLVNPVKQDEVAKL